MEQQEKKDRHENDGAASTRRRRRNTKVGVVVSNQMQKTVVVAVERLVRHPLYKKRIRRTSTFMAHDEHGASKGDAVRIVETRPMSKRKRWRVAAILAKGSTIDLGTLALPDITA
jgi:small subunit ribosomal protein S17